MRTNESLPPTMSVEDYNAMTLKHYSEIEQSKRIAETISLLVTICNEEDTKDFVSFKNVWKYLDIDNAHMDSFFSQLRTTPIHGRQSNFAKNGEELIIKW